METVMHRIDWLNNLCISEVNGIHLYISSAKNYPMRNKGRYHHGLAYTMEGTETLTFYDKKIAAVPDSVVYLPKGEKYTIDLIGDHWTGITLDFEIISSEPIRPFCIKLGKNNTLKTNFADAEKAWKRKRPDHNVLCKALLYTTFSHMIQQEINYLTHESYGKIAEAVDYLHKHYMDRDFKIESLFQISRISPKYFETLFFEQFHMTPKAYVISLKIERARELLISEHASVGDIAEQLGYNDIYHFSKTFKAKTGYTPSEFRNYHFYE